MRKTTQKNLQNILKIEKIDFQNSIHKSISDIRFEPQSDVKAEPTPTLKQIIEYHKNNKQLFLRLYAYPLERLPKEVCELKHLQGLSVLHCRLHRLPSYIADLNKLRHLFLINNRLTDLPNEIVSLRNLQYLDVSENQLLILPNNFEYLFKLTDLYLDKNLFSEIPKSIVLLNKLIRLGLSNNQLTELPNLVYEWSKLIRLDLSNNQLTDLPTNFAQLPRLEWLDLSGNPFIFIPQSVLKLPKLELLFMRHCGLVDLPRELAMMKTLQVLDISGNAFYGGKIPSVVFQLPLLEELIATDCGILSIEESDFIRMKNLCIIRLQNNKIRYISRRLAQMEQAEEFNFSGNPLEYIAPEMGQLPLLHRFFLEATLFENETFIQKGSSENKAEWDTYEPEVIRIQEKYCVEKRRNFL